MTKRTPTNNRTALFLAWAFLCVSCTPQVLYTSKDKIVRTSESSVQNMMDHQGSNIQSGTASYYADKFHGRKTSNGEIYNMNALTAAHRTLPFGTMVRVTNLQNNKFVSLRINDRGPFVKERIIDVSLAAARELDMMGSGTAQVKIEVLEWGK